jgi:Asp-tRNA(Asn)/Glu-tRNA(Gln) amidotransferase A subunit family amidase
MALDAYDSAAAVRSGDLTAEQLVENALARIDLVEPDVNAFTVVLREQALSEARAIDDGLAAGGRDGRAQELKGLPLLGVPVSVKDHVWLAGTPATNGSVALQDFVPDTDAVAVARLKAAGAVVVGKTNNPEFCYRGYTRNDVWGLTRNPWSLDRTPGGSSGGAGAAVAYGATPVALGTDGGGSIRIPAAFCGVVGHKPTFGLIPTRPGFRGWPTLSVHGPITRTVRDAALAVSVMAGATEEDTLSWPVDVGDPLTAVTRPPEWSSLRIAVSEDLGWAAVEPSVRAAFRAAVAALADDGAQIVEAAPRTPYPVELWNTIALAEGFASEGPLLEGWGDRLGAGTREIIEAGRDTTARQYLDAQEERGAYARTWAEFFCDYDLLLAPSMPLSAFSVDVESPDRIDGVPVDPFFDDWCVLALPANLTGQPACAVPTGFDPDGLPVGMQIIGPRWTDARVLAVAAAYERLAPWHQKWPPVVTDAPLVRPAEGGARP